MPDIEFPQLHDLSFLRETLHIPAHQLATELGCDPLTVEKYRQMHGLLQRPRWTQVEIELLTHFYGHFPAAYICHALRRSQQAVYTYAYRHGLKADTTPHPAPQVRASFWATWQQTIQRNWSHWAREGLAEGALDLLWRPATAFPSCQGCPHLPTCRSRADNPLPCEQLTVREILSSLT